jgi:hypothetical protein
VPPQPAGVPTRMPAVGRGGAHGATVAAHRLGRGAFEPLRGSLDVADAADILLQLL